MLGRLPIVAALFFSCAPQAPPPTIPARLSAAESPTKPSWQRRGDVGQLAFIRRAPSVSHPQTLAVSAVFLEEPPTYPFFSTCTDGPLCLNSSNPNEQPYVSNFNGFSGRNSWVGDEIIVGELPAIFQVTDGIGNYQGAIAVEGFLPQRYPLTITGGEWGSSELEGILELPPAFSGLYPDPSEPISLGNTTLSSLEWEPQGGELALTLTGTNWTTTRRLEDDGVVWLDWQDLRFAEPVTAQLWRLESQQTIDVNGNTLEIIGVSEQSWCIYDDCTTQPFTELPQTLSFDYCWTTTSCGTSSWQVYADGTWTSGFYRGTWSYDCCNHRIVFTFTSGTVYSADLNQDRCFDGEIRSWSGNRGQWSGCL